MRKSEIRKLIKQADAEAEAELANHPLRGRMGFCHILWEVKKTILKERYGIDWKSPAEENPLGCYD